MSLLSNSTGRGELYNYRHPNGKAVTLHVPTTAVRGDRLNELLKHVVARVTKDEATFLPEVAPSKSAEFIQTSIVGALKTLRRELAVDHRAVVERKARLAEPLPLASADAVFERSYVEKLERMSFADRTKEIMRDDLDVARSSALLRHGDLKMLAEGNATIISAVERKHAIELLAYITSSNFAVNATPDNPLPTGVDHGAVRVAAVVALDKIDTELSNYQDAAFAITETVRLVATVADLDADAVMAEVMK